MSDDKVVMKNYWTVIFGHLQKEILNTVKARLLRKQTVTQCRRCIKISDLVYELETQKKYKDTWTSNSTKSIGNWAAELKERIEFSLIALILISEDCNMFIPFPLCPINTNFGHLCLHFLASPSSSPSIHKTQEPKIPELRIKSFLKFRTRMQRM